MIRFFLNVGQALEPNSRSGSELVSRFEGMLGGVLNRDDLKPFFFLLRWVVVPPATLHLDLDLHDVNHYA